MKKIFLFVLLLIFLIYEVPGLKCQSRSWEVSVISGISFPRFKELKKFNQFVCDSSGIKPVLNDYSVPSLNYQLFVGKKIKGNIYGIGAGYQSAGFEFTYPDSAGGKANSIVRTISILGYLEHPYILSEKLKLFTSLELGYNFSFLKIDRLIFDYLKSYGTYTDLFTYNMTFRPSAKLVYDIDEKINIGFQLGYCIDFAGDFGTNDGLYVPGTNSYAQSDWMGFRLGLMAGYLFH